jgi:hypothetical protein
MIVAPQGAPSAIAATQPSPMRWGRRGAKKASTALLHSKKPVVANPSYAAYTWSPIGADVPIPGISLPAEIGATFMKTVRFVLSLLALSFLAPWPSAKAADVICYNCPPEWADWASMLKAIKADLNYDIPHDNKNSGQALAQILA